MSLTRCTWQVLLAAFVWLALGSGLWGFGDPRGFLTNEVVTETPLYPGVTWYRVDGKESGLSQVTHVVKVDISEPHLTMKALAGNRFVSESSGQFFRRSQVSHMQTDNDSLVAINTAFFDISSTMAPRGLLLQDKRMLREPQAGGSTFVFTQGGVPAITGFGLVGALRYGTASRSFNGINRGALSGGQINVYQQPWDRSPGTSAAFTSGLNITEVVLEKTGFIPSTNPSTPARMQGRVLEVRNGQGSVSLPENRFVITAAGSARGFLQQMVVNATVEVEWRLSGGIGGLNWNTITQGVAGGSLLIGNGQVQSQDNSHWNARHPRSSIGISADGSQLVFLLVEGRQAGRAEGMSLHSLARYHQHLGARNALEFDGGGSSAIAARVNGRDTLLNTPSDNSERYVPAGLGVQVVQEPQHTLFKNIRVASGGSEAVVSWETVIPTISHLKFGQADLDRTSAREPIFRTRHTAVLSGVTAPGFYYCRLVAELESGATHTSQIVPIPPKDDGEIIIDDPEAIFTGSPVWSPGAFRTPWGEGYRHTTTVSGPPTHTATYRPAIHTSGLYDVYTWYTQGTNRTNDARYQILFAGGTRSFSVNQTTNGERWRLLASNLRFNAGGDYHLRIINQSSDGGQALIADAARWVLKAADPVETGVAPVWWMTHFFGENPPDPAVDADGDGAAIADEYRWGTDPTDPDSRARYTLEKVDDGSWRFVFSPFHEGRTYRLQGRGNLNEGSWQNMAIPSPVRLESGEGLLLLPNPGSSERVFYRLVVE